MVRTLSLRILFPEEGGSWVTEHQLRGTDTGLRVPWHFQMAASQLWAPQFLIFKGKEPSGTYLQIQALGSLPEHTKRFKGYEIHNGC